MGSPKKSFIPDPDYEMSETANKRIKLMEEKVNKDKLEKIKEIINREFENELNYRQSQLELIQHRLNQAQKTLHLLRYVLISTYYNKNETEAIKNGDATASVAEAISSDKNRLHPAVKKLLDHNSFNLNLSDPVRKRGKISYFPKKKDKLTNINKKSNIKYTTEIQSFQAKEAVKNSQVYELDTNRNRKKYKHQIRVGNISKWVPSENKEDLSTHKWMVYVRGSKENPDISNFVRKVVFYLHPSYQPNDVIEIRDPPFHLCRRGWGEFPIRVKIYFQYQLNKPIDIYHNLKLDQTFSGRQQLGNETVKDIFLYSDEPTIKKEEESPMEIEPSQNLPELINNEQYSTTLETDLKQDFTNAVYNPSIVPHVKEECDEVEIECSLHNSKILEKSFVNDEGAHFEHDYCYVTVKSEPNINCDLSTLKYTSHNDMLTAEHSYFQVDPSLPRNNGIYDQYISENPDTDLIYGLNEIEQEADEIIVTVCDETKNVTIQNSKTINHKTVSKQEKMQSFIKYGGQKNVINNSSRVTAIKHSNSRSVSLLINHSNTKKFKSINYNKYKIDVPSHRFKDVAEVLPYLFKQLPLISSLALDTDYKCTYPYVAKSIEEYSNWNIGRRLSSEWYQAKTVRKVLRTLNLPNSEKWTNKMLIMYARSHGYTPICTYRIFKNNNKVKEILNNLMRTSNGLCRPMTRISKIIEADDEIDIEDCTEPAQNATNKSKYTLIDYNIGPACSYIKQAVLDVGIILKPEEIISGVMHNTAERMLLQASLSLAEDIIRKARATLVFKGDFQEDTCIIGREEIKNALLQRLEFNQILENNTVIK